MYTFAWVCVSLWRRMNIFTSLCIWRYLHSPLPTPRLWSSLFRLAVCWLERDLGHHQVLAWVTEMSLAAAAGSRVGMYRGTRVSQDGGGLEYRVAAEMGIGDGGDVAPLPRES